MLYIGATMHRKILALFAFVALAAHAQQPQTQTAPIYSANAKYVQGVGPGYWPTAGSGLTLNLSAGTANCAGTSVTYAGSTLTMTASRTNYVFLNRESSCVPASNTSGFGMNIPIAKVVAGSSTISSISDVRTSSAVANIGQFWTGNYATGTSDGGITEAYAACVAAGYTGCDIEWSGDITPSSAAITLTPTTTLVMRSNGHTMHCSNTGASYCFTLSGGSTIGLSPQVDVNIALDGTGATGSGIEVVNFGGSSGADLAYRNIFSIVSDNFSSVSDAAQGIFLNGVGSSNLDLTVNHDYNGLSLESALPYGSTTGDSLNVLILNGGDQALSGKGGVALNLVAISGLAVSNLNFTGKIRTNFGTNPIQLNASSSPGAVAVGLISFSNMDFFSNGDGTSSSREISLNPHSSTGFISNIRFANCRFNEDASSEYGYYGSLFTAGSNPASISKISFDSSWAGASFQNGTADATLTGYVLGTQTNNSMAVANFATFFPQVVANPGSTGITTLGTIGTGVWQGTTIGTGYGGTGGTSVGAAQQNLGISPICIGNSGVGTAYTCTIANFTPSVGGPPITFTADANSSYGTDSTLAVNGGTAYAILPSPAFTTSSIGIGSSHTLQLQTISGTTYWVESSPLSAISAQGMQPTSTSANLNYNIGLWGALGGYSAPVGNTAFTANPSTGVLSASSFAGAMTGLTGTCTTCTSNSATLDLPIANPAATGTTSIGSASTTWGSGGNLTKLDGIATDGNIGQCVVVATVAPGLYTAPIASTNLIASTPSAGMYRITEFIDITVSGSNTIQGYVGYYSDGHYNSHVVTNAVSSATQWSTTVGYTAQGSYFYADASTVIQYAMPGASFTGTYRFAATLERCY